MPDIPMRILQLCNKVPYPPKDGGALASWQLTRGLFKLGCEVHLLSLNTSKHHVKNNHFADLPIVFETVTHDTRIRHGSLVKNLLFSRAPYNLQRFYSTGFVEKIEMATEDMDFDIVLLEGLAMTLYIPILRQRSAAKIILRAHNVEHQIWQKLAHDDINPLRSIYFNILSRRLKTYETRILDHIDALVTISMNDNELFRSLGYSGPLHNTPFAMDPDHFPQPAISNLQNLLFLGALDWTPNIDGLKWFVRNVWTSLKIRQPNIKFYVAGRNPDASLPGLLLKSGVTFLGELENLEPFFRNGTIMVVPLKAGSGMRVKIIESMARGLCVVTTSQGLEGIPAIPGKHIFLADTEQAFVDVLINLIENQDLCKKIGKNARTFIQENFDNFVHTTALLNFFNSFA